jgi:hypothetical protein
VAANLAIVSAARDVVYLPDSDLGHPLLVLGIWLARSAPCWPWSLIRSSAG